MLLMINLNIITIVDIKLFIIDIIEIIPIVDMNNITSKIWILSCCFCKFISRFVALRSNMRINKLNSNIAAWMASEVEGVFD